MLPIEISTATPTHVRLEAAGDPDHRILTREGGFTLQQGPDRWSRHDLAGRWRAAALADVTYRRALSGRVIAVRSRLVRGERFHDVSEVDDGEARRLEDQVLAWAREGLDAFGPDLPPSWREVVARAAVLDPEALARDAEAFHRAYRGSPITPPDQGEALLLQSTIGCAHNACTFCTFYQGVPFRVQSEAAFAAHVQAVRAFLAPTLPAHRRIFLGDASALMVKPALLARHLELARPLLSPDPSPDGGFTPSRGIHYRATHPFSTFCDTFLTPLASVDELRGLSRLGLDRAYLGIESGAPEVLELVAKPATREGVLDAAERLHAAGIRLSIIVMLGVGGRTHAERHVSGTVDLLERMGLGPGDIVQFSELFVPPGSDYEGRALARGIEPMSRSEARAQMRVLVDRLGLRDRARGVRMQMYDSRQIVY